MLALGVAMLVGMLAAPSRAQAPADDPRLIHISNPMQFGFPWDLTHVDRPAGAGAGVKSVVVDGQHRPVQVERVTRAGETMDRIWFVATIEGEVTVDDRGRSRRSRPPSELTYTLSGDQPDAAAPGVAIVKRGSWLEVNNQVATYRIRIYDHVEPGTPLRALPHWLGGMSLNGSDVWDGRAWFVGDSPVAAVRTRVLAAGPVFVDIAIEYTFASPAANDGAASADDGQVEALPLAMGKQTHTWAPNQPPREMVTKQQRHYEVRLRFVMGDPWVEVNERYHFPGPAADSGRLRDADQAQPDEPHEYFIHWGDPNPAAGVADADPAMPPASTLSLSADEFLKLDTAMWVPWFEYDRFGGNTRLTFHDLTPRPTQKGRPFAQLRPRWHQRGGGAQDLLVTRGGEKPEGEQADAAPAVGVVASFASKWVGPYRATIMTHVRDGSRAWARFPLRDGQPEHGGLHYGQRSYALVMAPRSAVDSTGSLNGLVRRHTDWTLVAQMNKYILKWERDPSVAGANILLGRAHLRQLRADYEAGRDTPEMRLVRDFEARLAQARANPDMPGARGLLRSDDAKLLALIKGEDAARPKLPAPGQYFATRYQDDANNPTNYGNRRMVNGPFPMADLFSVGKPFGGPAQAAIGYIYTDLDAWPGWHQGWNPGNPNFHTDKYIASAFAGAAMSDHPHAAEWLEFGRRNFLADLDKVLLAPDGVGWECPGYAAYALSLQMENAELFKHTEAGNLLADNPLVRATAVWHRKLLTPPSVRLGQRHEAPHGDTHRWNSGMNSQFAELATYFTESDPAFARELVGTWALLKRDGTPAGDEQSLMKNLLHRDLTIEPAAAATMDWSSEAFYGFGAIMRSNFGTPRETFLSMKAGPARGHYHNDELAFHYYAGCTPISLDYNCSYHPRADHAALHNSMTFGREGQVRNNQRDEMVGAHEQLWSTAWVGAFETTPAADVVVAERSADSLVMSPIDPHDHEFARGYPTRKVEPITHRRLLAMIRHEADSKLSDYLVVREEVVGSEPQQLNVHLLAREVRAIDKAEPSTGRGPTVHLTGQWDKDMLVAVVDASSPEVEVRGYHYVEESVALPVDYTIRPGESQQAYAQRMAALAAEHGQKTLPLAGWSPTRVERNEQGANQRKWHELLEATHGQALAPPPNWNAPWLFGEHQVWLRIQTQPGTDVLWVLYPYERGAARPTIERVAGGKGVRVTLGDETETIYLASTPAEGVAGTMVVERGGARTVVLGADQLPPIGRIPQKPLDAD